MGNVRSRRNSCKRKQRRVAVLQRLESRMLLAGGLVDVGIQPTGALTGKIVYASAGHGWRWNSTLGRWATDRGNLFSMVEDLGNQDQLTFYVDQLHRAGATVVPMRPVGRQINEVVLDNDSPDVTYSGSWVNNTTGPRWYDEDYGAIIDPIKYRFASVKTSESAVANYTPNIPAAGMYPVYAWALNSINRTNHTLGGNFGEISNTHAKGEFDATIIEVGPGLQGKRA